MDRLMTVKEVAERTGLSAKTIYYQIAEYKLPCQSLGPRSIRLKLSDVTRHLEKQAALYPRKS